MFLDNKFGEDHGVIYVDRLEDALMKAVRVDRGGTIGEHGPAARRFVERYKWDGLVDEFENVLEEVIKVRGGK